MKKMSSVLRLASSLLPAPYCALKAGFPALAVLILVSAAVNCQAQSRTPRNLILVTIDTLSADRVGCYGYARARTPVLDRLAGEGVRFERAFAPVPLTLPSHASLMTGTYPLFHGVRDNSGFVLAPEQETLAEHLSTRGYQTAAFIGGFVLDSKFGIDQGFHVYDDEMGADSGRQGDPAYIQRRGDEVVARALQWLQNRAPSKPLFLWVHLYDPHDPYTPPEPYSSRHPGRPYDGEVEFTDAMLGRLVSGLEQAGLYEESLLAVAADHGESLGAHGEPKHGLLIYNATLHVPLILRLPGGERAGTALADPVSLVDLFPTFLQLLELPRRERPEKIQGRGLASLLLGKGTLRPAPIYAESHYPLQFGWSPLRAVVLGSQKYIHSPAPELYDLERDFGEANNLATEQKALAARLGETLTTLETRYSGDTTDGTAPQPDPETLEKLRSLGYAALGPVSVPSHEWDALPDPKQQIEVYRRLVTLFELSQQGRHAETIEGYRALVEKQPTLRMAVLKLGQAYFHTGRYEQAVERFKQAVQQAPDRPVVIFNLAQAYLRMGKIEEARIGLERTIELDPDHLGARTNLGVVYKNQKRLDDALEQLTAALRIQPDYVPALGNLGVVLSLAGRHEEGLDRLRKAIRLEPDNALLYANLAGVYHQMGDPAKAQEAMATARRLDPRMFQRQ